MNVSANRQAGILIPAFSARRDGDLGVGDTLALRNWIDWAAETGVAFLQLLPINENGRDESPYSAISSAALDPVYLALVPDELPWLEARDFERARARLGDAASAAKVDYPTVRRVKGDLLELAWSKFEQAGPKLAKEFAAFRAKEAAWLDDYCLFRHLMELHGEELRWDEWPETCTTPEKARAFLDRKRRSDPETTNYRLGFFAFRQWLCFRQWRALRKHADSAGVKLMGDIPIGVAWHSCDVFFQRENFDLGWCGGSPAEGGSGDPFVSQWGQNWGVPLYRWDAMERDGFSWWKQRIARVTEIFRMFRLDHILGFYRIYAFPWHPSRNHEFLGLSHDQAAARTGGHLPHWNKRPDDTPENKAANLADGDLRLRGILKGLRNIDIIAEDLGWVPDYVRPHLAQLGVAGFRIPHWDCDEHGHPTPGRAFPENSFACYSTHDHDPLPGIWNGCVATIRRHLENPDHTPAWQAHGAHHGLRILSEFAGIPVPGSEPWPPFTEGIRLRLVKSLFDSNARYAVLMVTELFGLTDRINEPGTTHSHNWGFRIPWTVGQIRETPRLAEISRKLSALIHITGRAPAR